MAFHHQSHSFAVKLGGMKELKDSDIPQDIEIKEFVPFRGTLFAKTQFTLSDEIDEFIRFTVHFSQYGHRFSHVERELSYRGPGWPEQEMHAVTEFMHKSRYFFKNKIIQTAI